MEYAGKNAGYFHSGLPEALAGFCFSGKAAPVGWKHPPVSIDIAHLHGLPPPGFNSHSTGMMHETNLRGK